MHVEKSIWTNYQHLIWGLDFSLSLSLILFSFFHSYGKKIDDLFGFSSLRNFRPRKFKSVRSFIATLKDEAISVLSFLASINGRDEKFANFPATTFFPSANRGYFSGRLAIGRHRKSLDTRRAWGRRMKTRERFFSIFSFSFRNRFLNEIREINVLQKILNQKKLNQNK